jgi:Leu/Phe-tRNA-protein transferase
MAMFIWIVSLIVVLVITARSYRAASQRQEFVFAAGLTAGDLLRSEITWIRNEFFSIYSKFHPHLAKVSASVGVSVHKIALRGYGIFTKNVFGEMHFDKGKNASFFVKHIREFKQELREERLD